MTFATNGDVQVFYECFGDAADPTLVLVNGLGSQCINYRVEWCERFAAKGFQRRADGQPRRRAVDALPTSPTALRRSDEAAYTLSDMASRRDGGARRARRRAARTSWGSRWAG